MLPRLLPGWEFIPCILSSKPSLFGWRQRPLQSSGLARDVSGDTEQASLLLCAYRENLESGIPDGMRKVELCHSPCMVTSWEDEEGKEPSSLQEEICHVGLHLHPKSHLFRQNSHRLQQGVLPE